MENLTNPPLLYKEFNTPEDLAQKSVNLYGNELSLRMLHSEAQKHGCKIDSEELPFTDFPEASLASGETDYCRMIMKAIHLIESGQIYLGKS